MKLSTKSRYGLRILLQIAIDSKENKTSQGKAIARKQEISEPYLEQIMIPLKNAGVVRTVRGCNGGYFLNRVPEDISVLDIIELFEGEFKLVDCLKGDKLCSRIKTCYTTGVWEKLSNALRKTASEITLATIIKDYGEHPDYMI